MRKPYRQRWSSNDLCSLIIGAIIVAIAVAMAFNYCGSCSSPSAGSGTCYLAAYNDC